MKRVFVFGVVVLFVAAFLSRGKVINSPVVFNHNFTKKTTQAAWVKIRNLDKMLPKSEKITIYLNSHGGDAESNVILLERIAKLKKNGRKFVGVIYGYCYSACASLFSIMNVRYMTRNSAYLQHGARSYGPLGANPANRFTRLLDRYRLIPDAKMLRTNTTKLVLLFEQGDGYFAKDIFADAHFMLKKRYIHAIVDQPDIEEI